MKHIAIAGGTGFVGEAMVSLLLENKYKITVISRDTKKVCSKYKNSVQALSWDDSNNIVKDMLKDCSAIVNLSGTNVADKKWNIEFKKKLLDSRLITANKIIAWQKILPAKPHILFASALSAYGLFENNSQVFKESDKVKQSDCFLSEISNTLENLYNKEISKITSMRFALVMDPSGGLMQKFLPTFKICLGAKIGAGNQPWPWVSRNDLVNAIKFCIEKKITGPVNMVSPEVLTQKDFAKLLAKSLSRPLLLCLPETLLKFLFGSQMATELFLLGTAAYPSVLEKNGFKFNDANFENWLKKVFK